MTNSTSSPVPMYHNHFSYENIEKEGENEEPKQQQKEEEQFTNNNSLRPAVIALCLCTFTQAYLLISIFPYAGYMVIHLFRGNSNRTITQENAGTYAGILSSSLMVGRLIGSYPWGKCADIYGRKIALIVSLIASGVVSLGFGFAGNFLMALIFRFILGLVNSIIGTTKTVVSELAHLHKNPPLTQCSNGKQNSEEDEEEEQQQQSIKKREAKMMGLVIGMRSWGYLMAPAIGGIFSEPLERYPNLILIQYCYGNNNESEGSATNVSICHWLLSEYPFVLPNIIGTILCFSTALAVYVYIEETLPVEQKQDWRFSCLDLGRFLLSGIKNFFGCCCCKFGRQQKVSVAMDEQVDKDMTDESQTLLPLIPTSRKKTTYSSSVSNNESHAGNKTHNDTLTSSRTKESSPPTASAPSIRSIWSRPKTRHYLELICFFAFYVTCFDEALPLYCISQNGGLGLTEQSIGSILSGAGLIFAFFQYGVYSLVVAKFGMYKSLKIGSLVGTMSNLLIPLSLIFTNNGGGEGRVEEGEGLEKQDDSNLNWKIYIFLVLVIGTSKIFCCLFFSSISVAMNQTVPLSSRGTMNGIGTVLDSLGRGLGPLFSGWLVAFCISSGVGGLTPKVGSVVVFVVICVLGLLVFFGLDEGLGGEQEEEMEKATATVEEKGSVCGSKYNGDEEDQERKKAINGDGQNGKDEKKVI